MISFRPRAIFTRLLLGIGYTSLVLEWLWVFIVGIPPLIKTGAFDALTTPANPTTVVPPEPIVASPVLTLFIGIITLIILGATAIVLIRIPRTIVQTGERIVHQAAEIVVPVVTHHKPLPAKKKRILSRRIIGAVQISASLLPALISIFLPVYEELSGPVIVTTTVVLSIVSIVGFGLAWLLAPAATSRTQSRASRG